MYVFIIDKFEENIQIRNLHLQNQQNITQKVLKKRKLSIQSKTL